ncbi:MAG: protein translocase subunit SecD, partial [Eggerthellaceae bacterium]|nr:protein translocase subunit SecD [Eggerthellaceae bacterium]
MTFIAVVSVILFMPPSKTINQGLDLQGGLSVVLTAKSTEGGTVSAEEMEASRSIIESRVNALGATEATVQVQGDNQILVQLPGMTDTEAALATIGKTGKLVFARLDSFTDADVKKAIEDGSYMGSRVVYDEYGNALVIPSDPVVVTDGTYTPLITGSNISRVTVGQASEASVYYAVNLDLDTEGTAAFAAATRDQAPTHGQIVIILDDVVQSAPAVQTEILTGDVSITGNYSLDEARALKTVLESGSLPVTFEYAQSQIVGPTLGQDTLRVAIIVALIGLGLVMLYLLFFYKGLGIITAAAMAVFAIMYLGLLALLSRLGQFSLTLAGLAGIVLTIGMAADSSILTLERFREEIRMGRSVRAASITGVHHAIMTSIDADLVTLVSALSLFFLASASVKGFGLTLSLGILCDILMMLIFKAPLIRLMAPRTIEKHPEFWGIKDCQEARAYELDLKAGLKPARERLKGFFIKHDINFLGYRRYFLGAAAVAMALCFILVPLKGLSFGIEFVGGSSATFYGTGDVTTEQVRTVYAQLGEPDAVI